LVIRASLGFSCLLVFASLASAAPTSQQREKARELETAVSKAGNLYTQGNFKECGEVLTQVQGEFETLIAEGDADMVNLLTGIYPRLLKAHALLALEGVRLPPLKKPGEAPKPETPAPAGGVSFTRQVAPLLVGKCGRCHVNESRGMFSMATFESLMKGPPEGVVVFPGDPVGSRLAEVIESGDMPRGGGKLTSQEFDLLKKWIAEGAKFDGTDRTANLAALGSAAPQEPAKVEVAVATGNEKISFSRDIAPVLVQECANCHGYGQRPSARLNMTTFQGLLTGGDSGPAIVPGKPGESLLIQKLKGEAGDRMPLRRPPLSDAVIAQFETWIAEGARFDGPDPATDVKRVADLYRAAHSNHEQLSADRAKIAEQNWRLGMPNIEMERAETANFLLVGNVGQNTLADIGQQAEALAPRVAEIFKAPANEPLVKGRATLFVFAGRYDYSEFGQMVEKRELPGEWRGHWNFDVIDAYGAVVVPRGAEYSLESLLGQQIAGAYIASLGDSPLWFREGAARVAASRLAPTDARVKSWDDSLSAVLGSMSAPADFLQGKLPPEPSAIASYSFMKFVMADSRKFDILLGALRRGGKFDQAFAQAYGAPPVQLTAAWVRRAGR
jgi:mono/diheme cytochrome c family protein